MLEANALKVAITSAFLTGHPLGIGIAGYSRLQRHVGTILDQRYGSEGWSVDDNHWREDGTYDSGGGFTSRVPMVLARRTGPDVLGRAQSILHRETEAQPDWLERQGVTVTPMSMRIDIYDLGMGVMNGTFSVRSSGNVGLPDIALALKRLVWLRPDPGTRNYSPVTMIFRELARDTTRQFSDVIREAAPREVQDPWLEPFIRAMTGGQERVPGSIQDWGRLLWLHPVHLLTVATLGDVRRAAAALAAPFHQAMAIPGGCFVPGIDWSALITLSGEVSGPLRLIELQWAYFALYMEIDRGLLARLDDDRWRQNRSLSDLEDEAERVFADFMRVKEANARVESVLASLGGADQAMWNAIADVQKLDALVKGVERKTQVLQRLADRRVQQAAAAQAHRSIAVNAIAVLIAVGAAVLAVISYRSEAGPQSDYWLVIALVLGASLLLAGVILYLELYRRRIRRGKPLGWG